MSGFHARGTSEYRSRARGRDTTAPPHPPRRAFSTLMIVLITALLIPWIGYLLYRERRLVQSLLAQQHLDREAHVRDLLRNSRGWLQIPPHSREDYEHTLLQAEAYGFDTGDITREIDGLSEPQILPAGSQLRVRRVTRVAGTLHLELQMVSPRNEFIAGVLPASFALSTKDAQRLHFSVVSGRSQFAIQSVALCLDCSESMSGEKMSKAIQATQSLLAQMPPGSRCRLFTFGNDVQATTPWTTDRDVLTEAAGQIRPSGRTALFRALATASTELSDRPGRRHLILCTDGKDTLGGETESEVVARCRQNQISLHTVGIEGGDVDLTLLARMAAATDGTSQTAASPGAIVATFQELSKQLTEPVYQLDVLDPEQRLTDLQLQVGGPEGLSVEISAASAVP